MFSVSSVCRQVSETPLSRGHPGHILVPWTFHNCYHTMKHQFSLMKKETFIAHQMTLNPEHSWGSSLLRVGDCLSNTLTYLSHFCLVSDTIWYNIASYQLSRRVCQFTRTIKKHFPPLGTKLHFWYMCMCCFVKQHGQLVKWLQTKNNNNIQLFRERLSEKMCTRQSRKVIWDMINTLFLTL